MSCYNISCSFESRQEIEKLWTNELSVANKVYIYAEYLIFTNAIYSKNLKFWKISNYESRYGNFQFCKKLLLPSFSKQSWILKIQILDGIQIGRKP